MEDALNGIQPRWKKTSMENILNGREPQWKTISMGKKCHWRKASMEEDFKEGLQEDEISLFS